MLGDLTEMQTLVSKIKDENFNSSDFLVQAVDVSERISRLASDMHAEAQRVLTEYQQANHFECVSNKADDLVDHDPGKRPRKLTDNQKNYLIKRGPCHPCLTSFPRKRTPDTSSKQCKLSASWFNEFPHLEYGVSKDAAFCFICSLFPEGPGRSKADPSWTKGNSQWSKMKGSQGRNKDGKLLAHFTSDSHKAAVMDFIRFTKTDSHVDILLDQERRASLLAEEKLRQQNNEVVTILLDVCRTLARQGLVFRGDDDDTEGNFQQITRLVSRHNPALKHWLESKDMRPFRATYMSGKSQNEFIQLLADAVRDSTAAEVSDAGIYCVMADTTPDVSNKDQLAVAVHYLDKDGTPAERLVQVKEVTDKTGEGLAQEILSSIAESKIDKDMLRFQTYDSASNMLGRYNGAQKKLSETLQREITNIPCIAHGANLVTEHSSKSSVLISSMYDILEAIYVFFSSSTKWCKILVDLLQDVDNALQLKNLSKTRWTARPESVEATWRSYENIIEAL